MSELHIGTKLVEAHSMTRQEYNDYRGWQLPDAEQHLADEAGYLVEYLDGGRANDERHKGYISWSPADVFEASYKSSGSLTFGHAIEFAKRGHKIARAGWNGKNMFAYIVPANTYPAQTETIEGVFENDMVPYRECFALKTAQKDVVMWSPSVSDALANDWLIVE